MLKSCDGSAVVSRTISNSTCKIRYPPPPQFIFPSRLLSWGGGTLTDCLDYNRGSNVNKYKEIYIKRDRECERG